MGTTMASGPASSTRLMCGISFQVTRTMQGVPAALAAIRWRSISLKLVAICSISTHR